MTTESEKAHAAQQSCQGPIALGRRGEMRGEFLISTSSDLVKRLWEAADFPLSNKDGEPDECAHRDAAFSYAYLWREAADRIEQLEATVADLKTVMVAAAEEISSHWEAHCDKDGYGPVNLVNRLERGLASTYPGYNAGAFGRLWGDLERARSEAKARIEQLEREKAEGWDAFYRMRKLYCELKYGDRLQNQVIAMGAPPKDTQ